MSNFRICNLISFTEYVYLLYRDLILIVSILYV